MAGPELSPPVAGAHPATIRKCVLIVEDNPLNMKLFSAMIEAQGYDVLQARDGSHGLALAQGQHPDLIIMDIQLPGMSGLEVTEDRRRHPRYPDHRHNGFRVTRRRREDPRQRL